jgi:hypothetical protein
MRILTLIGILIISFTGFTQISFYKLYSGSGYDRAEGIIQHSDSSYTLTGSSSSWTGNSDIFLLHLDSLGQYKWSRNYGGNESDIGRRVLYDPINGYFVAGYSNSFSGNGNFDAYLIRTDNSGNLLWEKTYGTDNWEKINDAIFTNDSSIIMVGESQPLNGNSTDIYIVKTNFLGDTIWTKTFGTTGNDRANTVINLSDSSFIIGGEMFIADSSITKGFVLRMNRFGEIIWQDTIGDFPGEYGINDVFLGLNKFYAVGKRKVTETNNDDYFGSFDFEGNLVFQYTLNTPKNTMIDEVAFLPGINRTVIGTRLIDVLTYQDDYDNILAYCDTYYGYFEGTPGSYCVISNEGLDKCNQILPTNDGGFIAVGFNSNTGDNITTSNGGSNIYVAKIFPGQSYPNPFDAINGNVIFGQLVLVDELKHNKTSVFPNPFLNKITILNEESERNSYTLINQLGHILKEGTFTSQMELDASELSAGTYFLKVGENLFRVVKF